MAPEYTLETAEDVAPEDLGRVVATMVDPAAREVAMTAAQKLCEEGRQEGREEGRREGRQEGRRRPLRQLGFRFGDLPEDARQRVLEADPPALDRWAERVLTAASLDEVFSD